MRFVLASHNKKKLGELQMRFDALGIEVELLPDDAPEPEETGKTFEENARIKALSAMEYTGLPAIADDSGLEVDALDGAPGVYSARYCEGTDSDRNAFLLANMKAVPDEKRTARFVSALACVFPDGRAPIVVRGTCEGVILHEGRGEAGFGYDPLFFVPEKKRTFAELSAQEKGEISHRGRAIDAIIKPLRKAVGRET